MSGIIEVHVIVNNTSDNTSYIKKKKLIKKITNKATNMSDKSIIKKLILNNTE